MSGRLFLKVFFCIFMGFYNNSAYADTALSQLVKSMQPGTWNLVNQNTFNSVWTPAEDRVLPTSSYGSNIKSLIDAWSGFAWDSQRSDLILYGGGHANYGGNDVYVWHSANLQWERASLPTQIDYYDLGGGAHTYLTVDNGATPQSSHTYDNNVYLPTLDRFLTFGGYTFSNPGIPYVRLDENDAIVQTGPYLFDPSRADGSKVGGANGTGVDPFTIGGDMWQNRDAYVNTPNAIKPTSFAMGMTDVAQVDGKDVVYVVANKQGQYGNFLYEYIINDITDPSLDSWEIIGSPHNSTYAYQGSGAFDSLNNVFVRTGDANLGIPFLFWDLNNKGTTNNEQSLDVLDNTGGLFPFESLSSMGMEYDPIGERFLLWGSGDAVYSLTHEGVALNEGWVLGLDNLFGQTAGPGNGAAVNFTESGGVLGKWDFASELGVFIGLKNSVNGEVWVYKPSNFSVVPLPGTFFVFLSGLSFMLFIMRKP